MAKKIKDSKLVMLEHSKAKVELFSRYLSIYLNDEKGSPVIAMECIKNHFFSNNRTCPNIDIWFNDSEKSEIEPELYKIERVKKLISEIFKPSNVNINYTQKDYTEVIKLVVDQLKKIRDSERALLFIDPWGYKEIDPKDLREIVKNGKTEIILFLPISFMYRFADKALSNNNFAGGRPLEKFLSELFKGQLPDTDNQLIFISEVKINLKDTLK